MLDILESERTYTHVSVCNPSLVCVLLVLSLVWSRLIAGVPGVRLEMADMWAQSWSTHILPCFLLPIARSN
jgi:hypothetical protein